MPILLLRGNLAALIGAQLSDHVFLLMTDAAVEMMFNGNGNVQLGADVGVAVGPVGRALEADFGAAPGSAAPIYTYSLSKGLYAGVSLDGKIVSTRHRVNENFYGRVVSGAEILHGQVPTPPAARPLYDALARCHVYASGTVPSLRDIHGDQYSTQPGWNSNASSGKDAMEYGEHDGGGGPTSIVTGSTVPVYPPPPNDQHSFAGLSHTIE